MPKGRWRFWAAVLIACGIFAVQGWSLCRTLLTWTDESGYLHLGTLAVAGRVDLFGDDQPGMRMPLPFWVLGVSQLIVKRDLLIARGLCLAFGVVGVVLAAVVGRQAAGPAAGVLAAFFLATQTVLIGYLTTATYHSMAAAILLASIALVFANRQPISAVAGAAVSSLLFLTRTNLWPVLPAVAIAASMRVHTRASRILIGVATVAVPIAFFASDARHAKVLAYVALLGSAVEYLGFRSTLAATAFEPTTAGTRLHALVRMFRTYEFWLLAALVPAVLLVVGRHCRRLVAEATKRTWIVVSLLVYLTATQVILFWDRLWSYVAYLPSWAPLCAMVLGILWVETFKRVGVTRNRRVALAFTLVVMLVGPMFVIRQPLKPPPTMNTLTDLDAAQKHFRGLIPAGAHVFLLGNSMPLYLAGIDPYVRQIYSTETLAVVEDRPLIERHGLWGLAEIDSWLGSDADFAVIQVDVLNSYRAVRGPQITRIEAHLSRYFRHVAQVTDYRIFVYDVYERVSRQ